MKTAFRLVLGMAIAALGFWLWTLLFPGPEKLILRKISNLAGSATFSAKDSTFIRAGKAGNLAGDFSTDAQVSFDAPGQGAQTLSGREEIRETALGGFTRLPALKVEFLDVTVRLGADRQAADVSCTARVTAGDNKDFAVQELHFQLKKVDGDWLITRAETVKTLQ